MRIAVVAATLLLTTSIATAQAPGETVTWDPEAPPSTVAVQAPPMTVSYRGQILAADAASIGLSVLGPLVTRDESLSGIGFAGFFVAAPIVHLAHGRGMAAAKSLGLRVALPFVGAMAGYRFGPDDLTCHSSPGIDGKPGGSCDDHGSLVGLLVGAAAGGISAMVIDVKYLARYQTTRPQTWSAGIQPTRGGMALSVAGSF
jgi:hypothetical protein